MATHQMKLILEPFTKILLGKKVIESRLYDEKRKLIKINDFIEFTCTNNQKITARVEDIYLKKSFEDLFSTFPAKMFGGKSKESLLKEIYQFYSKEDEDNYSVIGIKIKTINKA